MSRKKSISTTKKTLKPNNPHPMNIPTILYAIEALLLRIFVRPILNTVERFTGLSHLEFAVSGSLYYVIMTILTAVLALSSASVSFKGDDLTFVRIIILPIISLSVYYSIYLTRIAWARYEQFNAEKDDEIMNTCKIVHDPKRLGWYVGFIACIIVMYEHAKLPFVTYLLLPFCGFAPLLVLCGIRPYYNATEAEQAKRKRREMTTMLTLALLVFCLATYTLYKGSPQAKFLLISVSVAAYVLIYKLIRRKKHNANTQDNTEGEDAG